MGSRVHFLIIAILSLSVYNSHGCEMNGVISWLLPVPVSFQDVYRGVVFTGTTTNIQGINSVVYVEGLTSEQYLDFSIVNSELIISTTDAFQYYEENETAETMSVTVTFSCTGGSTRSLVFQIQVEDTNNNPPEFKPSNAYEFIIAPPVPPGYIITGCVSDMTVRDIDLTTERINFEIEENPYFTIEYDASSSTVSKEFKAIVKTITLIRSIPEPITLRISATDVDRTNDPPLTTYATIRIVADSQFHFPEEPLFTQSFYLADYSRDHQLTLASPISLLQGYDDLVQFYLYSYEGYTNNFALSVNGNQITMSVISPLPPDVLTESQIYLIVTAEREFTSGASATIIVQLPEVVNLQFQQKLYEGRIVDQSLQLENLILSQGYEDGYSVFLSGDYSSYFNVNIQENTVSITMLLLDTNFIEQNSFISFQVTAYNDRSSTTAVVTIEIEKDDNITPVFEKAIYSGTYAIETGLLLEPIVIIQGFDESVSLTLSGDYFDYFHLIQNEFIINLQATSLPQEIFIEQNLLLTLEARKPRTVGATTVISIALPPELLIEFAEAHYEGVIVDNNLQLSNLILRQGYEDGVNVSLTGEFSNLFTANVQGNIITLTMFPLSTSIIEQNNFINLQVIADNSRSSTTAVVTLEIIKDDTITPLFERPIYTGTYDTVVGFTMEQILLVQGYDDTVSLTLSGEHSNYFQIYQNGPVITLLSSSLPQSILNEQNLLITVEASKPRTVGANTVVSIALPPEIGVEFFEALYEGQIVDNTLQLTNLLLRQGYENGVNVSVNGEFSNFFTASVQENTITLTMSPLSTNILDQNTFINLQVIASTDRSSTTTVVMLEIIKDDNITPVFELPLYTGSYDTVTGLNLEEIILVQGYDDTVSLALSGEHSNYFQIYQSGPVVTLLVSPLPQSVLIEQNLLISIEASKPRTVGASTIVSIALPPEISIEFENALYQGQIVDNTLQLSNLLLRQGYEDGVGVSIIGEFSNFFTANVQENSIALTMIPLTSTIIEEHNFINLEVMVYTDRSSATTAVTLEIIKDDNVTPVFEKSFYNGDYSTDDGLTLEPIVLIQGYDETVSFNLSGDNSNYFQINQNGPVITLLALRLPQSVLIERSLLLFLDVTKPRTVGASTVIYISLPPEIGVEFYETHYKGQIVDNTLQLTNLILRQGFENGVNVSVNGEHSSYFTATVQGDIITLVMSPLSASVIEENNVLSLQVIASTERTTSMALVTLEIIKDDYITPVFEKPVYMGTYDAINGLSLEQITLVQGFDESVVISLDGEHAQFFNINQNGPIISLTSSSLPQQLLWEQRLLISVVATKPRTVGATATIIIELPPEILLEFQQLHYEGQIVDNSLEVTNLIMSQGYQDGVDVTISGEFSSFFTATVQENYISLAMSSISTNILEENNFITLQITASTERSSATAVVTLEIIKDDTITPVFERPIYTGIYNTDNGLDIEQIVIIQGFDDTVSISIDGEHANYFDVANIGPIVTLSAQSIPPQILHEQYLLLSVHVTKPRTVGASTTVVVNLPTEVAVAFENTYYEGQIIDTNLLQIPNLVLSQGYENGIEVTLSGEHSTFFTANVDGNIVTLTMIPLSANIIEENNFISIQVTACSDQSCATTIVILGIVKNDTITPVFDRNIYTGTYVTETGLSLEQIEIVQGFDETVSISLDGEHANYFQIIANGPILTLVTSGLPAEVLIENQLLLTVLANKPRTVGANTAVSITLPTELFTPVVIRFSQTSYNGQVDNGVVQTPLLTLLGENYDDNLILDITGDFAAYFTLTRQLNTIALELLSELPDEVLENYSFLVLNIHATYPEAISGYTTVVLEIIKQVEPQVIKPKFEQPYYIAEYSLQGGLIFEEVIQLSQGLDDQVTFRLEGDDAQWFSLVSIGEGRLSLTIQDEGIQQIANRSHLVFTVVAQKTESVYDRATIIVSLEVLDDALKLLAFERPGYIGSIEDNVSSLEEIILVQGYTQDVSFSLNGEFANYFTLSSEGAVVNVVLSTNIAEESIPSNGLILIELRATSTDSISATTAIVFKFVRVAETLGTDQLVFDAPYYAGYYSEEGGLTFDNTITTLAEGHDETVEYSLEGESSQWFGLLASGNSLTLTISSPIPSAVVANNQQLIFVVVAARPGSQTARATIVISLTDVLDVENLKLLAFERTGYLGSIEDNVSSLEEIILIEGYTQDVQFSLSGEFANYFTLSSEGAVVNVVLSTNIAEESIPSNGLILIELRATSTDSISATTAIVFKFVRVAETLGTDQLVFDAPYYAGYYSEMGGLTFDNTITLAEGHDETVEYFLEGESSQWFGLLASGNSLTLTISSPIPSAVVANNQQLIFVVVAARPGSQTARATIVISLTDVLDVENLKLLAFERTGYLGSIEDNVSSLEEIILIEGYTQDVQFSLSGEFANYFTLSSEGAVVNVVLSTNIAEESIPSNGLILIELRATSTDSISATTAIVFKFVRVAETLGTDQLVFDAPYYAGYYSEMGGLTFDNTITLAEGHDETVEYFLEGESSQWFGLLASGNSLTLTISSPIPSGVVANNQQLIFVVVAARPGSQTARATIVISLTDVLDVENLKLLAFERTGYLGSIEDNVSSLEEIILIEGYTQDVQFSLSGEFANYFTLSSEGAVVNVVLSTNIAEESIPSNGLILIELRATSTDSISATTAIVFKFVRVAETLGTDQLVFDAPYYAGYYSEMGGLTFDNTITLAEGHDETVEYFLEGESSQWFGLLASGNSLTLTISSPIPSGVVANNQQLIFVVVAARPGSQTARATIVISLTDVLDVENLKLLAFERTGYLGSIEDNVSSLEEIILIEGYTQDVQFSLSGEFANYFTLSSEGAVVNVVLSTNIAEESIPSNGLILIELRATSTDSISATTAIVFKFVRVAETLGTDQLVFDAPYYAGYYSEMGGLWYNTITLAEGHDETVEYFLEGESSQWFGLLASGNSLTLTISSPIPSGVVANNQQLIFVVVAARPGSQTARATIVISLTDVLDVENLKLLAFERTGYLGSIEDNVSSLEEIILIEGYTQDVQFSLSGEFANYFTLSSEGAVVNVVLSTNIAEESIPSNGLILIELRATSTDSISATTAIVFKFVRVAETLGTDQLVFDAPYYAGYYSEMGGLTFDNTITLAEGHDETVEYFLEGESSQWFGLLASGNSLTLTISSPIPSAVVANNQQLIFVVVAARPGSQTARATIVISLTDVLDVENLKLLAFERTGYLGSIEDNVSSLEEIILIEGYTQDVQFSLSGEFANYFTLSSEGAVVNVVLSTNIAEESIPSNGLILIELRATSTDSISATTAIVFKFVRVAETLGTDQLVFDAPYYAGYYSEMGGLTFDNTITLAEGHDETVEYFLEGESSQWFGLLASGNSLTLTISSPIPSAVVANNQQLIFVVVAARPGSQTARATIVISLTDVLDVENLKLLAFERTGYLGSIEDNVSSLEEIILIEGYTQDVQFSLSGEFANYFTLSSEGAVVNVVLSTNIAEESIPSNGLILIELRATSTDSISATTAIVFKFVRVAETLRTDQLVFDAPYYAGYYSEMGGLTFDNTITLAEGHDETVEYSLEGESSQWFGLLASGNSLTLTISSPIPSAVVANNQHLIFVVVAARPGSQTARATIVISLTDVLDVENLKLLAFERTGYLGSIEDNVSSLEEIILIEGYTQDVQFSLSGEFANYFTLSSEGAVVNVVLSTKIAEESIPSNGLILIELRATSTDSISATTAIVFKFVRVAETLGTDQLVFDAPYYAGYYSEMGGLTFDNTITLAEGHDETVEYSLEGESSQWFGLLASGNSLTLTISSPIPSAVVANNQQLIFVVVAARPGSQTARATIVISLTDVLDVENLKLLAFERTGYLGSIEDNVSSLEEIILIEGYTQDVQFSLSGEFANYFTLSSEGAVVNVVLSTNIAEESIPSNGLILIELRATSTDSISATTAIVFKFVRVAETLGTDQLVFDAPYYAGYYSEMGGLTFDNTITLAEGHDETVEYSLEGESSQWFGLLVSGNSLTLTISSPIPSAVVANNQQLIFVVVAARPGSPTARATIVISLTDVLDVENLKLLAFERTGYLGSIEDNVSSLEEIILIERYTQDVQFSLSGEFANYFTLSSEGAVVNVVLSTNIAEESIPSNGLILIELRATSTDSISATTAIVFKFVRVAETLGTDQLVFDAPYYAGYYSEMGGLTFDNTITLAEGHDETVEYSLEGESSQWFGLLASGNSLTLTISSPIPSAVVANNQQLIFVVVAARPGSQTARATIVISLTDVLDVENLKLLAFERTGYLGSIEDNVSSLEEIILIEGYTQDVQFSLSGEFANYFTLSSEGAVVNVVLSTNIAEESIPSNGLILIELRATSTDSISATTAIVFKFVRVAETLGTDQLVFDAPYYAGYYSEMGGLTFDNTITLAEGHDETVEYSLEGESSQWFGLLVSGNSLTLTISSPIPSAVVANNQQLIFVVVAARPGSPTARATIVISLTDVLDVENLKLLAFERTGYLGSIEDNVSSLEEIILIEGYTQGVQISLSGEFANHFTLLSEGPVINVMLSSNIQEESIPSNGLILLELRAASSNLMSVTTAVIFQIVGAGENPGTNQLAFTQSYYTGSYSEGNGFMFNNPLTIAEGYDETVEFSFEGDDAQWFSLTQSDNSVYLDLIMQIPTNVIENNQQLLFVIRADKPESFPARSTIVVALNGNSFIENTIFFDKNVYTGITYSDSVQHETITLTGYTGTTVNILGEYSALFVGYISDTSVYIQASGLVTLPSDVSYIVLELQAGDVSTVLILDVIHSGSPVLPYVTFNSASYILRGDISQTGLVGQVLATADNGEVINYSLILNSAHLEERLAVNNEGELRLSAPANSGVYVFQVLATTAITRVTATAQVQLTVDAFGGTEDNIVVPPLIVIDRDEEQPHQNLVVLDRTVHEGCWYTLTNHWPIDQTWLYVDENGLHTTAIDREHESIAFMALSQVQVELILHCETDAAGSRKKRSLDTSSQLDWLGRYNYGSKQWLLADTILYNSRRSFVNLIVNDINDNAPIFDGKENEPITVGYPISELEDTVLPRALSQLKATDADIGENAALMYWSDEPILAVSPTTGFVHVRDIQALRDNAQLTVYATDRNGAGLTGSIQLLVRLLNVNHIAVLTVRDAFLDDEPRIIGNLSNAVGYNVKVLRSVVMSDDMEEELNTRTKRQAVSLGGASLQLYVYGLIERVPVAAEILISDINNNALASVIIAGTASLEDYLQNCGTCEIPGRDTGLLVAVIVLSILLFLLIIAIIIWYCLNRKRMQNYQEFSDVNSLASQADSLDQQRKTDTLTKPKIDIDELKRREQILQEMLDAPIEHIIIEPTSSRTAPVEAILNMSPTDPKVIQSIDKLKNTAIDSEDEDEFGEKKRKKSVVTFNDIVKKIQHIEDRPGRTTPDLEVYKL